MRRGFAVLTVLLTIAGLSSVAEARPASNETARRVIVRVVPDADPLDVAADHGARVGHVYRSTIHGFAAVVPEQAVHRLSRDGRVESVDPDAVVSIAHHRNGHDGGPGGGGDEPAPDPEPEPDPTCPGSQVVDWGVDKIEGDLSSTVSGDCSGAISGVSVYVIDTGVDKGHGDLNVVRHQNFASGPNRDCNGHGTHVAGTIAAIDDTSDVVGVAPGAPVTGVKVLGCSGSGWLSDVIAGVEYVTENAVKPAVANMSLGGGKYQPLDDAVAASAASGVFYAVAAGNDYGADACTKSPAAAGVTDGVATVGASTSSDTKASFSNDGSCVDIWAPGVGILSTAAGGGTTTLSGTSMASPHVAGAGALYLSGNPGATPGQVENALKAADVHVNAINRLNVDPF